MMRRIKNIFLACILLGILALIVAPWLTLAEIGLHIAAARYGYPGAKFTLESVSPRHMALRDVSFGNKDPITFDKLRLAFTREELNESRVTIEDALARWEGGTLSVHNGELSWAGPELLVANITVRRVPLNNLMQLFTGNRATATGIVSGELPVIIYADRSIVVQKGYLKAEKAGTITVSPELIPADNPQVGMVREVLNNFHYKTFSMDVDSRKDKKLSMLLQLHGNNPNAYNGRPVNLNIRLQGDLLSLIEQSIMPIVDPKKFLEQVEE